MRAGSAGRSGVRGEKGGGRWAFAQGANRCVYVPLQDTDNKRSALHYAAAASYEGRSGLESIVAKLLSLGADAALVDKVRACSYMNTCMYISLYVFIRMKGSCSNLYPSLHLHAHTRKVAFMHAYMKTCTYTDLMIERESSDMNTRTPRKYTCVSIHTNTRYIYSGIHTCTHTHSRAYIHALMCIHTHTCRTG